MLLKLILIFCYFVICKDSINCITSKAYMDPTSDFISTPYRYVCNVNQLQTNTSTIGSKLPTFHEIQYNRQASE
jgi:hypothetical protein